MTDEKKHKKTSEGEQDIKIDYENIDVADIMDQIKTKIATQPKKEPEFPLVESDYVPYAAAPPGLPPEASGVKSKIKARILEKDFEFLGRREKALEDQVLK